MILEGTPVAKKIKDEVRDYMLENNLDKSKYLAVIQVGDNQASTTYVNNKIRACDYCNIGSEYIHLPENTLEEELLSYIYDLNYDTNCIGILVQLPLPKHIDEFNIAQAIEPEKDVDCFNPYNVGLLHLQRPTFLPCTPAGIIEILDYYNIPIEGKDVAIVGRSNIVGRPLAELLEQRNATVTLCHSNTKVLEEHTTTSDITVFAVGKPKYFNIYDVWNNEKHVVIDVGINRDENGKLCGDFDSEGYFGNYTPVPKGVGVMTIAMLMKNCKISLRNLLK